MSHSEQKKILVAEKTELLNLIKHQELEIKKLKDKYENEIYTLNFILQNLPASVYWKDREGIYLGHNVYAKNLLHTLGFDSAVIGKTDYDIFPREVAENFRKSDLAVLEGKRVVLEEVTTLPDGKQMIQLSSKIPLPDKSANVIGVLGITIDITDKKQAELAKEEFVLNMSHDLRTPLAGIIGVANLQAEYGASLKEREYGKMVQGAGKQLLELLNSVLKVINAEEASEQHVKQKNIIHLAQLAGELQELIRPSLQMQELQFELKLPAHLPTVASDYIKLKHILINLLSNAIKFTPKGGQVSLVINLLAEKNDHAEIEIQVIDTGIGMAADKIEKIFERFYRIHPAHAGVYPGSGVGLYLVKRMVSLLGGEIQVSSQEGKGSCFTLHFTFPIASESPATDRVQEKPKTQPAKSGRKGAVLLAEDNVLIINATKEFLENLGYNVEIAVDGPAALHALQTKSFLWALLDIGLPEISGHEVLRRYRLWEQETAKPHLPIFALTAHESREIKQESPDTAFDAILSKPFSPQHIQIIEGFLQH
jgi:two-component system, OmpR family, aerobic respiration control sensor histidine kinase ArcB